MARAGRWPLKDKQNKMQIGEGKGMSNTAASGNAVTTKFGGGYSSIYKTGLSADNSKGFGARLGGSVGVDIGSYSNWGDQQCECR